MVWNDNIAIRGDVKHGIVFDQRRFLVNGRLAVNGFVLGDIYFLELVKTKI